MAHRILIVEPDKLAAENVMKLLTDAGYDCTVCYTAHECLFRINEVAYNLIITEMILPDMSGVEFCRELTQNDASSPAPLVILSSLDSEMDRVVGLSLGATDYIVKPCFNRELVLRVRAILRRTARGQTPAARTNNVIHIDRQSFRCQVDGVLLRLTPIEFRILAELVGARGRVLTREQIIDAVWEEKIQVTYRTVDVHIRSLRKKLRSAKNDLETVHGVGYRISQHSNITRSAATAHRDAG